MKKLIVPKIVMEDRRGVQSSLEARIDFTPRNRFIRFV